VKTLLSPLLGIALIGLSTASLASTKNHNTTATQIVSATEPQFTVQLPGNATTGYQWYLTHYDRNLIALVSYHYNVTNPKLMGSGGTAVFVFKALPTMFVVPQQTALTFNYGRAWEGNSPSQLKTVIVSSLPAEQTAQVATPPTPINNKSSTKNAVQSANMMVPVGKSP